MPIRPPEEPGVWQELRKRRVTRTAVSYLAYAFFVVEVVWLALPGLDLPPWAGRAVVGAAVLGFPLATVLAYTFDITPGGIVRTPDQLHEAPSGPSASRMAWLLGCAAAVAGGVLIHLLRS